MRWAVGQFRAPIEDGQALPSVQSLMVDTWFREPDYGDDYRQLHALEQELSDETPQRPELLSIWRLARDEEYAPWAKSIGVQKCQVSFFGLEEATDWFCRRTGAFHESVTATERLLDAGVAPRWQFFLTRKILPDLPGLMALAKDLQLRERVAVLSGAFELFIHPPGLEGSGRLIEDLVPTMGETAGIPEELLASSRRHFGKEALWRTEAEWLRDIMQAEDAFPYAYDLPENLYLFVTPTFDVYSNMGTLEPWWRLGNLKQDSPADILARFENNDTLGLRTVYTVPARTLAAEFGNAQGQRVYSCQDDLLGLYVGKYCEREYQGRDG